MAEINNAPASPSKTIIIGLSGPSSSGKTTLARLLRQIFNVSVSTSPGTEPSVATRKSIRLFILHEDDFYKTDKDIPLKHFQTSNRTLQDWDCIESLDLPLFSKTLKYIKAHGSLPPDLSSKEDKNTVGESGVPDTTVQNFHSEIKSWLTNTLPNNSQNDDDTITICLLDGFLLYPSPHSPPDSLKSHLLTLLDSTLTTRLFIPSTRTQTITRRNARKGYVTMEGFWEDPEGYVEEVVWPNYGEDHLWLFGGADVNGDEEKIEIMRRVDEGEVDRGVAREWGIEVGPGTGEVHLREILEWAVKRIKGAVEGMVVT